MTNILILHADTPAGRAAILAAKNRDLNAIAVNRNQIDTADESQVRKLAFELDRKGVDIDILVTCPFSVFRNDGAMEDDGRIIRCNLNPAMLFCKVFGQQMLDRRQGRIIQLVSNVSIDPHDPRHFKQGVPSMGYAAAMGGVQALSRHLAAQYQDAGVLINNIVYGPLLESEPAKVTDEYVKRVPMGRVMTIKDLANTMDLLLDPNSSYITGQNILADGGVSIW